MYNALSIFQIYSILMIIQFYYIINSTLFQLLT